MQSPWKTVWRFLKKLKIELSYNPAIPLLDVYSKKTKTLIRKDIHTPMFIAALLTIAKIWKQLNCPSINKWIKKMWYTHTHTHTHTHRGIFAKKKIEILPFETTWLDVEGIMLSEIS